MLKIPIVFQNSSNYRFFFAKIVKFHVFPGKAVTLYMYKFITRPKKIAELKFCVYTLLNCKTSSKESTKNQMKILSISINTLRHNFKGRLCIYII